MQFNNGEHGFDNGAMDMKTIFRAVGPSFRRGLEVEPFESVHVYELLCKLLGIVPEANDGHLSTLLPMLTSGAESGGPSTPLPTPTSGANTGGPGTSPSTSHSGEAPAPPAPIPPPGRCRGAGPLWTGCLPATWAAFSFPVPGFWTQLRSLTCPRHLTPYNCSAQQCRGRNRWMEHVKGETEDQRTGSARERPFWVKPPRSHRATPGIPS